MLFWSRFTKNASKVFYSGRIAPIIALIRSIVEFKQNISALGFYMNLRVEQLGLLNLQEPAELNSISDDPLRMRRNIEPMGLYSMVSLIRWQELTDPMPNYDLINYGASISEYFEGLSFWYHRIKSQIPKRLMSRRESLNLAMSLVKTDSGADKIFAETILGTAAYHLIDLPPTTCQYLIQKYRIASEFVAAMGERMGLVLEAFFCPSWTENVVTDKVYDTYELPEKSVGYSFTFDSLSRSLNDQTFSEIIRKTRSADALIQFKMPFLWDFKTVKALEPQMVPFSYRPELAARSLETSAITQYAIKRDEFFDKRSNAIAFIDPPRWYIKNRIAEPVDSVYDYLSSLHTKLKVFRDYFTEEKDFTIAQYV
jgi:hypothetical protein